MRAFTSEFSRLRSALRWMAARMFASESLRSWGWVPDGGPSCSWLATEAFRERAKASLLSSFSMRSSRAAT